MLCGGQVAAAAALCWPLLLCELDSATTSCGFSKAWKAWHGLQDTDMAVTAAAGALAEQAYVIGVEIAMVQASTPGKACCLSRARDLAALQDHEQTSDRPFWSQADSAAKRRTATAVVLMLHPGLLCAGAHLQLQVPIFILSTRHLSCCHDKRPADWLSCPATAVQGPAGH